MSKLLEFFKNIFCKEYPIWAYGLECDVCKMSFGSAELHYKEVIRQGTLKKHEGKIPKLK
jgi:hypothetical protein